MCREVFDCVLHSLAGYLPLCWERKSWARALQRLRAKTRGSSVVETFSDSLWPWSLQHVMQCSRNTLWSPLRQHDLYRFWHNVTCTFFFFFSEEVVRFFFFQKFSLQSCCKTVHLKSLEIEPIKAKDFSGSMKNQSFMNLQIYILSQKGIIIIVFFL